MDEFSTAIAKLEREIVSKKVEAAKKVAIMINNTLVLSTPVDTGRARANWQANLGSPVGTKVEAEDKSGQSTITKNNATILSGNPDSEIEIHLTNNLEYIIPLNNGHSQQAPAGFIEKAVQVARGAFK